MPQLVFLALAASAAYLGSRWVKREMARIDRRTKSGSAGASERGARLEKDPETGVYRPERAG